MQVETLDAAHWTELIQASEAAHFLQTVEWAQVKAEVGWSAERLAWRSEDGKVIALVQVLTRSARLFKRFGPAISIGYIPRGPLLMCEDADTRRQVLKDLAALAQRKKLVFLKIDPYWEIGRGIPGSETETPNPAGMQALEELDKNRWRVSPEQIQFKNTVVIDLAGSEETWLARMKQKTRYNIRLAARSGVVVRKALPDELPLLYRMYVETANRDGFIIRPESYYLGVWQRFIEAGMADALIAEAEGTPVAGLVLFHTGRTAWYVYGMSTQLQREKMPNYLLQWEVMRIAKDRGCESYDLWGAPDSFDDQDRLSGVFRFKEGLGGEVVRTIGAWDLVLQPVLYWIYMKLLPRLLDITRSIRRKQIQQEVV